MTRIAQVIVDVPIMQTNKPYTYRVPKSLYDTIQPGMRVIVPFGKGNRRVQGVVVEVVDANEQQDKLKSIDELMDLSPVLNEEMIQLGQVMAEETFSFQISCYQTMLPAVLRATYEKRIKPCDHLSSEVFEDIFCGKDYITWEDAIRRTSLAKLNALHQQGYIEIVYHVTDRSTTKTKKYIVPCLEPDQIKRTLEGIRKNAKRQITLLNVLTSLEGEAIEWQKLKQHYNITAQVLKQAVSKGWCSIKEVEVYRDPYHNQKIKQTHPLSLTEEQQHAYNHIHQAIEHGRQAIFLLQGVTGSGKTEVYMQTIAKVLEQGKGALMLVPEIALSPQMTRRFKGRFGERVAVLHSGLSDSEKYDEWRKVERGEASIVVGARSSIFAPIKRLGIIIIDEEHESTYKQEESPRYHARDVAIWRGAYHHCPVILGSATPSLESRARAYKGRYALLRLNERVNQKPLPLVKIVDMREEFKQGNRSAFSNALLEQMEGALARQEQIVLLLNRRGYSSFMMCRDCGDVLECPNCDISQTLHMDTKTMKCHYCGHEEHIPNRCPTCHSTTIRYYGTGTQKVEEALTDVLPTARIIRMDVDTTRRKGAHEKLLDQFGSGKADILLGTQMIAKGLDFPNVTLVGVLNADTALGLPDFRSAEHTFQLLTQVSGRAGRGNKSGQVIVQTFNPDHYAIQLAQSHDYEQFFKQEMQLRRISAYSPYYFLIRIMVSHESEMVASKKMADIIDDLRPTLSHQTIVLGPTPRSIARTNNRYHFQTIIKYKKEPKLNKKLQDILINTQKDAAKGLYVAIDPTPINFM